MTSLSSRLLLSLVLGLPGLPALAQDGGGGMMINDTVFRSAHIGEVTTVTKVFGSGQRAVAVILHYDTEVAQDGLSPESFEVSGRTVIAAHATAAPSVDAAPGDGAWVVLNLDETEDAARIWDGTGSTQLAVSQTVAIRAANGGEIPATETAVINTRQQDLVVESFRQFTYADPETGLLLRYNLYIPEGHEGEALPLVLFMHDAGVTGSDPLRALEQGLGAIGFASAETQARHPAMVLAPQYPVGLVNDAAQASDYVEATYRLVNALADQYGLDRNRLYTTGQSGGCMTSILLNIRHPDFFAASLLVAGQWPADQVAPMAGNKIFAVVSQDDNKAWPGMTAIMDALEDAGAQVSRDTWDGTAEIATLDQNVAELVAQNPGSDAYFASFAPGTVFPAGSGDTGGGSGHTNTWRVAYQIDALRDWLLSQSK